MKRDKEKQAEYKKQLYIEQKLTRPFYLTLKAIKDRCNSKSKNNYKYYKEKGIKCSITEDELKILWFRDKAYLMDKPSIERKNSDKNYTFDNCEYIEISKNISNAHKKGVIQYNLNGEFIKNWDSFRSVEKSLGIAHANIKKCIDGKYKQSGGFIWRYSNEKR